MKPEQAPKRIFLQNDDYDHASWDSASWCEDSINDGDVEYIRADLAAPAEPDHLPPHLLPFTDQTCWQQRDDLVREVLGLLEKIKSLEAKLETARRPAPALAAAPGDTSDGYHTFDELYEHRHALFAVASNLLHGWKSKLHDDGTMFDGWFIAGIKTVAGQATYHLPIRLWDRFPAQEMDRAPAWDGHTPTDVIERMWAVAALPSPSAPTEGKEKGPRRECWVSWQSGVPVTLATIAQNPVADKRFGEWVLMVEAPGEKGTEEGK